MIPLPTDSHESLAVDLAEAIVKEFSGESLLRVLDRPSRLLFVGSIGPRFDPQNPRAKYAAPTQMGLEFLLPKGTPEAVRIRIRFRGAFYYRTFPLLKEHLGGIAVPPAPEEDSDDEQGDEEPAGSRELAVVFHKIGPLSFGCDFSLADVLGDKLDHEVDLPEGHRLAASALESWESDESGRYRLLGGRSQTVAERQAQSRVPPEELADEATFDAYVRSRWTGRVPEPAWATSIVAKAENYDENRLRVSIILRNLAFEHRTKEDIDNSVYETRLEIGVEGAHPEPFVLDELKDDYRFDGKVPGKGINCTVRAEGEALVTEHAPIFLQRRYKALLFDGPGTTLGELSRDPLPPIRSLLDDMRRTLARMESELAIEGPKHSPLWRLGFETDVAGFRRDVGRISTALDVLSSVPEALEAFTLMNQAFSTSKDPFQNWRRFQIIFALLQVPDSVSVQRPEIPNLREKVDVIYFPTGGGKTEAYLAAVVFQMFFDRLTGKRSGVSALTKFPLRLLSLQQIQRIADIFAAAEVVRQSHPVIGSSEFDAFSTGYYVGEGNTPNTLIKEGFGGEEGEDNLASVERGGPEAENWRIIPKCPFPGCDGTTRLEADRPRIRLIHRCTKCSRETPVYVSDDEIYRYLPTLIIGTLDKIASAGFQRKFRQIYGSVTGRCRDHGYFGGPECAYAWGGRGPCKRTDHETSVLKDPTPSILVQDEIHLVRESLGSYDSHYETFLDTFQQALTAGHKRVKIIAASATISQFHRQLHHLYLREGVSFPSHGPDAKNSFYAQEDTKVARVIVGILPRITPIFSVLHLIRAHHQRIRSAEAKSAPPYETGVLSDYDLGLCYNLKKMEADEVANSVRRQVNTALRAAGISEIDPEILSGDVTFGAVRSLLDRIQQGEPDLRPSLVVATSAISHGVDLDSMNFMVFHGMPTNTAEYVQAYSRVGRTYPGIVFVVFNPLRERDMSHYENFRKYHEVTDLLVEPVPINRWAKFSILRTVPGIFSGALISYFEPILQRRGIRRLYMLKDFADAVNRGDLKEEEILEFVRRCYGVATDPEGAHFASVINEKVATYVSDALQSLPVGRDGFLPWMLADPPMISLRDTDTPVEISAEAESFHVMRNMKRGP